MRAAETLATSDKLFVPISAPESVAYAATHALPL
jgi:hypothetical protein